jgi:hypothetical protein
LWYGNVYEAFPVVHTLAVVLEAAVADMGDGPAWHPHEDVEEFCPESERNRTFVPNDGKRMSTSFIDSRVNQVVGKRCCQGQGM